MALSVLDQCGLPGSHPSCSLEYSSCTLQPMRICGSHQTVAFCRASPKASWLTHNSCLLSHSLSLPTSCPACHPHMVCLLASVTMAMFPSWNLLPTLLGYLLLLFFVLVTSTSLCVVLPFSFYKVTARSFDVDFASPCSFGYSFWFCLVLLFSDQPMVSVLSPSFIR